MSNSTAEFNVFVQVGLPAILFPVFMIPLVLVVLSLGLYYLIWSRSKNNGLPKKADEKVEGQNIGQKAKKFLQVSAGNVVGDLMDLQESANYEEIDLYDFEKKKIIKWKEDDVREWLGALEFGKITEKFISGCKNGKELVNLRKNTKLIEDLDLFEKQLFLIYLKHIKDCAKPRKKGDIERKFSLGYKVVLDKIIAGGVSIGDKNFPINKIANHVDVLSDPKKIKKFLLPKGKTDKTKNLKVKLIITENTFKPKEQFLRKIVSPIVDYIPHFKKSIPFGLFHSALIIGTFYVQWTDSQVVVPKKVMNSGSAIISIDTDPLELETEQDFENIRNILSEVIAKWNTKYTYKQCRKKNELAGNCQDFVIDVIDALGIELNLEDNCFGDFVSNIRKHGECKIQFDATQEFVDAFKLREYHAFGSYKKGKNSWKIGFNSHEELDNFLYHCYRANPLANEKFPSEYRLLKSFDRAYWLRHLKDMSKEEFKPAPGGKDRMFGSNQFRCGCPFSDPRETGTYV